MSAADEIRAVFAAAGARGLMHARDLHAGGELGVDADTPVATASVIKIVLAIAFAREVAAGRIDPGESTEVPADLRIGGAGTAGFADPTELSLRDLARLMLTVSDNAATDLIYARVVPAATDAVLDELGLRRTHLRSDMTSVGRRVAAELGFVDVRDLDAQLAGADPDRVRALRWLDPGHANASTPRELTALLAAIWDDRAGPPAACAWVRAAMAGQVNDARLASGFGPAVRIAGKTGTLPGIRNEAGVVESPDGRRVAVAVFTRSEILADRNPAVDRAIGHAAAIAVDALAP